MLTLALSVETHHPVIPHYGWVVPVPMMQCDSFICIFWSQPTGVSGLHSHFSTYTFHTYHTHSFLLTEGLLTRCFIVLASVCQSAVSPNVIHSVQWSQCCAPLWMIKNHQNHPLKVEFCEIQTLMKLSCIWNQRGREKRSILEAAALEVTNLTFEP